MTAIDIPARDSSIIWGVDFSGQWDGTPDMSVVKDRGASFVYIKAADGKSKVAFFEENVANARAAGLVVVGAYFWLYRNVRISCTTQANTWWSIVKNIDLDFYMIDFEWTKWKGKPDNPTTSDLRAAVDAFQQASGKAPWIYTGPAYADEYFSHQERYKANPLIIAHYEPQPASIAPWGPNGHTIHQVSEAWPGAELGVRPDCSQEVDGDVFNGDEDKFVTTFHLVRQARAWHGQPVTIRTSPQSGSSSSGLPSIQPGTTVSYVKVVDDLQHPGAEHYKWLQLDEPGTQFARYIYPPTGKRFELFLTRTPH